MSRSGFFVVLLSLVLFHCFTYGETASIPKHRTHTETCGYEACPVADPNKLNIHLVPHTHDDVGWLKTVDQYYFGSRPLIQKAGVQYILDSVIQALLANADRKFIYVETAFLWKWWLRQNEKTREDVKMLINEGRLEIIGGGWSMNDEAVTHYHSLVDQFTWGFRRLNDTFGSCARPHIGWQIDPFGHSREQASIFAQMGFDGMFFGRMDYQDKSKRIRDKAMEYIWKGSPNLGGRADLFTVALYNHYSPPPGFCFDVLCADEPIVDDPRSPDNNVKERRWNFNRERITSVEMIKTSEISPTFNVLIDYRSIDEFLEFTRKQATAVRTNNIILTMGGDFTYQHAEMYFMNLDKIIRYVKEQAGSTVNIFYSTPSCYVKALHDSNISWPTKTDDLFPYASDPHSYWTGYFSSRPTIKFFERMGNNFLQISKQLSALVDLNGYDEYLEYFREAMGIMQHHDAVTGTEKQLVAEDYARILHESMLHGEEIASGAISKWNKKESESTAQVSEKMHSCMQLNISSCPHTEDNKSFVVTMYNPLSQQVTNHVRLPVQGNSYAVRDLASGDAINSQIVPIPDSVMNIPGRFSKATNELVFRVQVPPLGYKTYAVVETEGEENQVLESAETFISTDFYDVSVTKDGQISVQSKKQKDMNYIQSFHYYEGTEGDNKAFENRSSGAYIFRPRDITTKNFVYTGSYKIYKGPVVDEIHQIINQWISQVVRIYKGQDHIEFDWLVGPIPVKDKIGKEIVTKYSSSLNTNGEFYTDSNGREMLKRKRDYRPTWDLELFEPVAGNYYPITSKISLKDEEKSYKLSVLVDRAQGGSSLHDGEMEVMLHRRLLKDDAFGVGEALNETAFGEGLVVRGLHYVFGGSTKNLDAFALREKSLTLELSLRPWTFISPVAKDSLERWSGAHNLQKSGLAKALLPNVHILTLEPWKDGTILLRLEHLFEIGEAMQLSQPVEVNIQDLFSTFTILSIDETTLGGNQWLKDMNRLKWETDTNDILSEHEDTVHPIEMERDAINVLLKPMEIRTFIVRVSR